MMKNRKQNYRTETRRKKGRNAPVVSPPVVVIPPVVMPPVVVEPPVVIDESNMRILNWNNTNSTYPTKNAGEAVNYVGHVNPAELGYAFTARDKWTQKEGVDSGNVINVTNMSTIASVLSSAPDNSRIVLKAVGGAATVYRDFGDISYPTGKSLTIVGEVDSNGNNLVTFDGSADITGSWTSETSYYYHSVPAFVDWGSDPDLTETQPGFYYMMKAQVWKDEVPMKAMPTKAAVNATDKFWYDKPNNRVYLSFNPTGNTIAFSRYRTFLKHAGAVDNFIIKNLNFTKYSGNKEKFLLGGGIDGGDLPVFAANRRPRYWYFGDINVTNCRAMIARVGNGSMIKNLSSSNNAIGDVIGIWKNDTNDYTGTSLAYTHYIGVKSENDGWAGGDITNEQGFKLGGSWQVRMRDCYFAYAGNTVHGMVEAHGLWLDFCKYADIQNCTFYKNNNSGLYLEISFYITVKNCKFIGNSANKDYEGEIVISNTRYATIQNNYFEINSAGHDTFWLFLQDADRGGDGQFNNLPDSGVWKSADLDFRYNTIKAYTGSAGMQFNYVRADQTNPAYKQFTGYNIVTGSNTYSIKNTLATNRFSVLNLSSPYNQSDLSLAGFQALTNNSSVSFGWEAGSTLTTF